MGGGQYGETYKVNHNGRWLACKKIHEAILSYYPSKLHTEQMKKLLKQINEVMESVKHPNIEKYDMVVEQTPTFLLLSELLFENLDKFVTRLKDKIPLHLQVNVCHDMAQGLHYLHSVGIVHKNLHSNNILITDQFQAKIADYICPQVLRGDKSVSDTTKRVFHAPEIKSILFNSYSSDIFSLGILFFLTVSTHLPAVADLYLTTDIDLLPKKAETKIDKIPNHHPLYSLIKECLSINKSSRPSASQVCNGVVEAKKTSQYILSYRTNVSLYSYVFHVSMYVCCWY